MDGIDDHISIPWVNTSGSAITLSAWVKNSSFASGVDQSFISKAVDLTEDSGFWTLGLTSNGQNRLQFDLRADRATTTLTASSGNLPLNTWYHVAATYDGITMRVFLNGSEVGAVAKSGSMPRGRNAAIDIGRSPEGTGYLRGAIDDVRIYSSALTATEIEALAAPSNSGSISNQSPSVSLSSPASGAVFTIPASISLSATASDSDGTISRVDFYAGSTLIGTDTSSPYGLTWSTAAAGSYALTAVARDSGGATTVSSTRDITVKLATVPTRLYFTPSSNDATAVDRYVFEVFPAGADTKVSNPVATQDVGKPPITNGQCTADVSSTVLALTPGTAYVVTVAAVGSGGRTQSAPSQPFTR
jgi:hypothetical protein